MNNLNAFQNSQFLFFGDPDCQEDITDYNLIILNEMLKHECDYAFVPICQADLTPILRDELIDWMSKIHDRCQISTNGLHIAVGVFDRILSKIQVSKKKLKLLGATSLLIGSKCEDIYPVSFKSLIKVSGNLFREDDIIKCEMEILNLIDYDLCFPTPLFFLTIFAYIDEQDEITILMARYIAEICLSSSEFFGARPSAIAGAAMIMMNIIFENEIWSEKLALFSGYSSDNLIIYVHLTHQLLHDSSSKRNQNIRKKYAQDHFQRVSCYQIPIHLPPPFSYF
jgi:hypothetical protein